MPSGGRRQGRPGRKYPNRSDMRKGPSQPAQATTGQTYGQAGQQLAAQAKIPLSNAPQAAPAAASPMAAQAAPGGMGGGVPQVIPSLTDPTARPNEPLTTGLSTGPGAGPSAIAKPPDPLMRAVAALNALGDTADPQTKALRETLNVHLNNQGAA